MPKPEWGLKHRCADCGTPVYDLMRTEFACPSCGKQFEVEFERGTEVSGMVAGPKAVVMEKEATKGVVPDDDLLVGADAPESALDDDVLDDDDDTVPLDDIANVETDDET